MGATGCASARPKVTCAGSSSRGRRAGKRRSRTRCAHGHGDARPLLQGARGAHASQHGVDARARAQEGARQVGPAQGRPVVSGRCGLFHILVAELAGDGAKGALLVDSSGLSILGARVGGARKGKISKRLFVKVHAITRPHGRIIACKAARGAQRDSPVLRGILDAVPDGGGDGIADKSHGACANCKKIRGKGRRPVIPPRDGYAAGASARAPRCAGTTTTASDSTRRTASAASSSRCSRPSRSGSEDSRALGLCHAGVEPWRDARLLQPDGLKGGGAPRRDGMSRAPGGGGCARPGGRGLFRPDLPLDWPGTLRRAARSGASGASPRLARVPRPPPRRLAA